jgi:uncharacterized damage-inducible protein DinB
MHLTLADLMEYSEWERSRWMEVFRKHPEALGINIGPNRDERFNTVGDWVRHIFAAEIRYVERLSGHPLTDVAGMRNDNAEELFEFGRRTRGKLKHLLETFPAPEWDIPRELQILSFLIKATPNKIAVHVVMHEIRHWAQIATLLRINGINDEFGHDFLGSPVMGGDWRRI